MTIHPDCDMKRWETTNNCGVVLANADYYYTKKEVDDKFEEIDSDISGHVQTIVEKALSGKADTSTVIALSEQVRQNTEKLVNTYTKEETNNLLQSYITKLEARQMFANYSKVENTTLILNNENITI